MLIKFILSWLWLILLIIIAIFTSTSTPLHYEHFINELNDEIIAETEISNGMVVNVIPLQDIDQSKNYEIYIDDIGTGGYGAEIQSLSNSNGFIILNAGYSYEHPPKVRVKYNDVKNFQKQNYSSNINFTENNKDLLKLIVKNQEKLYETFKKQYEMPSQPLSFIQSEHDSENKYNNMDENTMAQKYDEIIKSTNEANEQKRGQLLEQLNEINKDKNKVLENTIKAQKYGMKPPPSQFNDDYIDQIKNELKSLSTTNKTLSIKDKAKCYLLYNDMVEKSQRLQDLSVKSENNTSLTQSVEQYSKIVQLAINKYNSKCIPVTLQGDF